MALNRCMTEFRFPARSVFVPHRGSRCPVSDHWTHLSRRSGRRDLEKSGQPSQVDDRDGEGKERLYLHQSPQFDLPQDTVLFGVPKDGFDEFAGDPCSGGNRHGAWYGRRCGWCGARCFARHAA
jgi:hypothetical protein